MKLKTGILFNEKFIESLGYFVDLKLPVKISYPLKKSLPIFQNEEKSAKNQRDELIKKYGEVIKNEEGEPRGWDITKSSKENQENFIKELQDLFDIEFEIPMDENISVEMKELDGVKLSPNDLATMETLKIVIK